MYSKNTIFLYKKNAKFFLYIGLCAWFYIFYLITIALESQNQMINAIISIDLIFLFVLLFSYCVKFSFLNFHGTGEKKSYKLTQESIEMAKKIEGLKNYLKDFSIIYDCSYKEKIQWERF